MWTKDMEDRHAASQAHLAQVAKAITFRQLSTDEAIKAGAIKSTVLTKKFTTLLPFNGHVFYGCSQGVNIQTVNGTLMPDKQVIAPNYTFIKTDMQDIKEQEENPDEYSRKIEEIASSPMGASKKVFRVTDALGFRTMTYSQRKQMFNDPVAFARELDFHMLDWSSWNNDDDYTHLTSVDKLALDPQAADKVSLVRESPDRFRTWQDIHNVIEIVASEKMKENGITF